MDGANLAALRPADVERFRAIVLARPRHFSTEPSSLANRKLIEVAFYEHPYARPAAGSIESAPKIEVAYLKSCIRRVIAKDMLKVAVVGNVDPEVSASFSTRPLAACRRGGTDAAPDVIPAKPPQRAFIPLDVPQTIVAFGSSRRSPRRVACC